MTNEPIHLDPIESAWTELKQAETAGVFARTCVDTRGLVCTPIRANYPRQTQRAWLRLLPVAAGLGLAVALWGWMSRPGQVAGHAAFSDCFGGPTAGTMTVCREHDYDTDGDVDLADFSAYQLAFATVTR